MAVRPDAPSTKTQLKQLLVLAIVVGLIVGAVEAYGALTRPDSRDLFARLHGPRTPSGQLIIDPANGSFAGLHLGMPMASAEKEMPATPHCTSSPPDEVTYCDGSGLLVKITSACSPGVAYSSLCPAPTSVGPLGEIDIEATPGFISPRMGSTVRLTVPGSQQAVTTEGLHLGDSFKVVKRKYTLAGKASFPYSRCPGMGTSYAALVGENTVVFNIEGGAVEMISLFAGHNPSICRE